MLFLVSNQLWQDFHILLRYSTLIGDEKPINISCGRHLSLFFQILFDRHATNATTPVGEDEELLVFLSGDLQGGTNSWVWNNTETGTLLSRRQKHSRAKHDDSRKEVLTQQHGTSWNAKLSAEEIQQWGGWGTVYEAARHLEQLQGYKQNRHEPTAQRTDPDERRSKMTIASIT